MDPDINSYESQNIYYYGELRHLEYMIKNLSFDLEICICKKVKKYLTDKKNSMINNYTELLRVIEAQEIHISSLKNGENDLVY